MKMQNNRSRTPTYRVWYRQNRLGRFTGTFEAFLKRYGQRPDSFYLFNPERGWTLPRRFSKVSASKKNKANFRHGGCYTSEYFAYYYQRRNSCSISFQEFLEVYGAKPGPNYRFVKGKGWTKKEMKSIWIFLTPDEIFKLLEEVERVCEGGGYSYDEAATVFFTDLNLERANKPYGYALRWIRRYLTKTLSQRPKFVPLTALGEAGAEYNQELMDND